MIDALMEIEQAALRAWPAESDTWVDGWLVRRDEGYTKRANCVCVWSDHGEVDDLIERCRSLIEAPGQPFIVRETTFAPVPGLAERLAEIGLERFDETIVMTRPLDPPSPSDPTSELPLDDWMRLYERFEGGTRGNQAIHRRIIERIARPKRLCVQYDDGDPVSIGLAVADGRWLGLFDIATDAARRGRGFGGELVRGMMVWGVSAGCTDAYLQVVSRNEAAIRLYTRLGFGEAYRYHYYGRRGGA